MSHCRDLKLLRRAQKQTKRQLRQLAELELTGLTAVMLHAHTRQVTITLASATGAPITDALREALRERRQTYRLRRGNCCLPGRKTSNCATTFPQSRVIHYPNNSPTSTKFLPRLAT